MSYDIQDKIIPISNALLSEGEFGRVEQEANKPDLGRSGFQHQPDSALTDESKRNSNNSILAEPPNSYKDFGTAMSGYFIIPRVVTSDPRYKSARLKYQKVLHVLFENVAFAATTHAISTNVIKIKVGQFCVSSRRLAEVCNDGVKFDEDLVDKNIIDRAICFWEKCGFVRQEVIHGKSLITITVSEFYDRKKTTSEPTSEPKVSQDRATKEEDQEDKELKKSQSIPVPRPPSARKEKFFVEPDDGLIDSSLNNFSKDVPQVPVKKINITRDVFLTQKELDECIKIDGTSERLIMHIHHILDSPRRTVEIKNWVNAVRSWSFPRMKNTVPDRKIANEAYGRTLESTYDNPVNFWRVQHFHDKDKDVKGTLFFSRTGTLRDIVAYADAEYETKVLKLIKDKGMKKVGEQ